jgi:FlaA1/EpsC-like NDP-sugar epimerase
MAAPTNPVRIAGTLFVAILVVIAALICLGIYLALPSDHVSALLAIGVVALVFALVAYLARSLTRYPETPRALSWGFAGFGFAVLFLTVLLGGFSSVDTVVYLILILVALAVMVGGVWWMGRSQAADRPREEARREWDSRPPESALSYSTAQGTPGVSPPAPASSEGDRR